MSRRLSNKNIHRLTRCLINKWVVSKLLKRHKFCKVDTAYKKCTWFINTNGEEHDSSVTGEGVPSVSCWWLAKLLFFRKLYVAPPIGLQTYCILSSTSRAQLFEDRLALKPGLRVGFFFLCSKEFSRRILSVIFRASNHQPVDKKN